MFLKISKIFTEKHLRWSLFFKKLQAFRPKVTGKYQCQSLFYNKVAGLRPATLSKKRLWHRCFPENFAKFLRITFFIEQLWWLLLIFEILISHLVNISNLPIWFNIKYHEIKLWENLPFQVPVFLTVIYFFKGMQDVGSTSVHKNTCLVNDYVILNYVNIFDLGKKNNTR